MLKYQVSKIRNYFRKMFTKIFHNFHAFLHFEHQYFTKFYQKIDFLIILHIIDLLNVEKFKPKFDTF